MLKQIYYLIASMRPKQWIKNIIIFIPLIFSWELFQIQSLEKILMIFIVFSLFVWSTYIINDYKDREKDVNHPKKKYRPLASKKINSNFALFSAITILLSMLFLSYYISWILTLSMFIAYLINTTLYTFFIKKIEIIDVFSIAIWFVIRWLVWLFILDIMISPWLLIMLFFWALRFWFLKRYQEVKIGTETRSNISKYNEHFLEQTIWMITTIIIITYSLYTFSSVQSKLMVITIPFVTFWLIRYYYNIFYLKKYTDWIEDILVKDKFILFDIIIYTLIVIILVLKSPSI